jgi:alpha-N-arabinofuranosidase
MKWIIKILIVVLFSANGMGQTQRASIILDTSIHNTSKINKNIYGAFFEFAQKCVNGNFGFYAQEIQDRGFDRYNEASPDLAYFWQKKSFDIDTGIKIGLFVGGYNKNGAFYQKLTKSNPNGKLAIFQPILIDPNVSYSFYIYMRSDSVIGDCKLELYNATFSESYYSTNIGTPDKVWRKYTIQLPPLGGKSERNLCISFCGMGTIEIDEASLIPNNNKFGLRYEYYELLKSWKPSIMRYPGGCFADWRNALWYYGIGDIDQRNSPGMDWTDEQRWDFGWDNYFQLCEDLKIEPHITINVGAGNVQQALDLMEYLKGLPDSKYGKQRVANGRLQPYSFKMIEIGNEQYANWEYGFIGIANGLKRYVNFYDSLKKYDSSLICLYNGDIWAGREFFDTVSTIAGNKIDIYSHHPLLDIKDKNYKSDSLFLSLASSGDWMIDFYNQLDRFISEKDLTKTMKQGITEHNFFYNGKWVNSDYLNNYASGLANANHFNTFLRKSETMVLFEKTINSGIFGYGINKNGIRSIYPTPTYYILSLFANNNGNNLLNPTVECSYYLTPELERGWDQYQRRTLDVTATSTQDTVYIAVLNRNINESISTSIILNNNIIKDYTAKSLVSDNYLDMNTPDEPNKISPIVKKNIKDSLYVFPPHSFTMIAAPLHPDTSVPSVPSEFYAELAPNPFYGNFSVVCDSPSIDEPWDVQIFNYCGQEVYNERFTNIKGVLWVYPTKLQSGLYFIKISNGIYSKTFKVMKQISE